MTIKRSKSKPTHSRNDSAHFLKYVFHLRGGHSLLIPVAGHVFACYQLVIVDSRVLLEPSQLMFWPFYLLIKNTQFIIFSICNIWYWNGKLYIYWELLKLGNGMNWSQELEMLHKWGVIFWNRKDIHHLPVCDGDCTDLAWLKVKRQRGQVVWKSWQLLCSGYNMRPES